ncbi:hypothetical protein V1477_001087 [Vespula maculifrons]|uniref:Uncharacterized protein n=1 Tax=Vespula maculifrons TaxID=7453 RepID=A0ABD2D0T8_VESMC
MYIQSTRKNNNLSSTLTYKIHINNLEICLLNTLKKFLINVKRICQRYKYFLIFEITVHIVSEAH